MSRPTCAAELPSQKPAARAYYRALRKGQQQIWHLGYWHGNHRCHVLKLQPAGIRKYLARLADWQMPNRNECATPNPYLIGEACAKADWLACEENPK